MEPVLASKLVSSKAVKYLPVIASEAKQSHEIQKAVGLPRPFGSRNDKKTRSQLVEFLLLKRTLQPIVRSVHFV